MTEPTVISAWSAVSAFGVGARAFADGLRDARSAVTALDRERWNVPVERAGVVPVADARELLGPSGTRTMDRATALAVSAVGSLIGEETGTTGREAGTGVVLGTSAGSVADFMGFARDALTRDRPYRVNPGRFPNTVMNCAAGQVAIRHGLRGPNATVAGGRAAGLLALNYARRLQRSGRARRIVCGGVEEFSTERAWLAWHSRPAGQEAVAPLGEGCAVLMLDAGRSAGGNALAEVLAVETGLAPREEDAAEALARCLRRALRQSGTDAANVWAVAAGDEPGARGDQEEVALRAVLGDRDVARVSCAPLVGDTCAASTTFQITALLEAAEEDPDARGRVALVTTLDADGLVGCALLRVAPGDR
ncbi:beta-ketoacyl synthase N-terminal-like domain-containing protein [Streptomyces sp. NPDC053048]|uniref:beta-ketoacyl synthase N-terminal-like domain-containing protein n=1 Tax=Streptomyces sp. NPDC053048 TaxID=3365694 RepID=UPI0037D69263